MAAADFSDLPVPDQKNTLNFDLQQLRHFDLSLWSY